MHTKIFTPRPLLHLLALVFASVPLTSLAQQPLLQITSPSNGTIVNPGQTLSVSVTSPAGATFTQVDVIGEAPIGISAVGSSLPAQFSLSIPSDIDCGQYRLTAEGTTTTGQTAESASIIIDVERPDLPVSLSTFPSGIFLQQPSQTIPLIVMGTFADGSILDVTGSSYVSYTSGNTAVATVDQHGMVTAVAPGSGYIKATYSLGGNSVQVSVPVSFPATGGGATASNFLLSISPGSQTIMPGQTASFSVQATSFSGFTGSVALSVAGLPEGVSPSFSPPSVPISSSSTLTIPTTQSTSVGLYPLTITGTSGNLTASLSALLTVGSAMSSYFTFSVSPASQSLLGGAATSFTVSVTPSGGFNGAVTLSAAGLPTGATATFSPSSVPGSGSSTLAITTSPSTPGGTYTVTITGTSGTLSQTATVTITIWGHRDVGAVGVTGSANYSNGAFTISAAGPQIYGTTDGMHFVYQPMAGDGTIVARVLSVQGVRSGTSAEVGVMIRETLNANSTHGYASYRSAGPLVEFLWRQGTAFSTSFVNSGATPLPYWVKMARSGNTFSASISPDGVTWTQVGASQTISMATNVYAGLAVSSCDSNNNSLVTATIDNVSLTSTPAWLVCAVGPARKRG